MIYSKSHSCPTFGQDFAQLSETNWAMVIDIILKSKMPASVSFVNKSFNAVYFSTSACKKLLSQRGQNIIFNFTLHSSCSLKSLIHIFCCMSLWLTRSAGPVDPAREISDILKDWKSTSIINSKLICYIFMLSELSWEMINKKTQRTMIQIIKLGN